jgi:hypothetical protein
MSSPASSSTRQENRDPEIGDGSDVDAGGLPAEPAERPRENRIGGVIFPPLIVVSGNLEGFGGMCSY